ncbi:uncharacterized protein si:dkey-245f22.3 [Seriola aureovittata]|uniref:uncharacterized protein si:dkey-245f22.3 n=1 Tax=Seriola aureovittata TaxID=2871759 RepID=UPI0024BD9C7C|nr:uncharacterized protein si:dkey-245f22.3 [Seriola aureovittata]
MMDAKLSSADVNEKIDDGSGDKLQFHDSKPSDLQEPVIADSITAGALTEATSFSEQISTEDTELSSADISVNTNKTADVPAESNLQNNPKGVVTRAASVCSPSYVDRQQLVPQFALLPPSMEASTVYEVSQPFTSMSRNHENLKTTGVHTEADREDICATILLACLFCHPLDCLLATMRGCNECIWSMCSSLCGCEPTTLQPLLDVTHHCDLCGCLSVRSCLCDCPVCDICLQTTECLDLAMEISQMLYH